VVIAANISKEDIYCGPKYLSLFYFTVISTNVDRFLQYLADSIPSKFVTQRLLIYPPHLNIAGTLPLEKLIWCLHLPARQCASTYGVRVRWSSYCSVKLRSSFLPTYGLTIALVLFQLTIKYGAWCRIECIRCQLKTRPTYGNAWLTLVAKHCGRYWWMARDFRPVWIKKEASWTFAVIFRLKCTQTVCTNWIFFFILCNDNV